MQVRESFLRDMLRLFVWYPLRWIILAMPVRWDIGLLRMMGDLHFTLSRSGKRHLLENLARLRGDERTAACVQGNDAVREYFRNHYIDRLLIFVFPRFCIRDAEQFVETDGLEHLNRALQQGNGVVLVHGHFGPVHLPLVVLALYGYRMKQIGLPSDEGLSWIGRNVAFRLRKYYEAKIPADIIKADGFLRSAFLWLKDNGVLMITGDGSGTDRRVGRHHPFNFLGQTRLFPLGPAVLAGKTRAVIIPMFIVPGENKPYKIIIERPLEPGKTGGDPTLDITGQFVRRLEHYVSRFPGYMHFLDRFDRDNTDET